MNWKDEAPVPSWMGWSRGHWEGHAGGGRDVREESSADRGGLPQRRVARSGAYAGEPVNIHEAMIEDPKVYTRPLGRSVFRCIDTWRRISSCWSSCEPFNEELLYGRFVMARKIEADHTRGSRRHSDESTAYQHSGNRGDGDRVWIVDGSDISRRPRRRQPAVKKDGDGGQAGSEIGGESPDAGAILTCREYGTMRRRRHYVLGGQSKEVRAIRRRRSFKAIWTTI